jgi:hypothetical protein
MTPLADPKAVKRLKELNIHFEPEWDKRRNRWNIMHRVLGKRPYIVMTVKNNDGSYRPIDNRTYSHLRFLLWINNGNIVEYMRRQIYEENERRYRNLREADENNREIGKDIQPMVRDLVRAGNSSHSGKPPISQGADI